MSALCKNYLKGNCNYGNRCNFRHEKPNMPKMEAQQDVVRTSNPFGVAAAPLASPEASAASFKSEYLSKGAYALTSYGAMSGDVSPDELRWYGQQALDAILARERVLGVSLHAYKPVAAGAVAPSKLYPSFVPTAEFTVLDDALLSQLKW